MFGIIHISNLVKFALLAFTVLREVKTNRGAAPASRTGQRRRLKHPLGLNPNLAHYITIKHTHDHLQLHSSPPLPFNVFTLVTGAMASISQTAIDTHGYCFQLPRMGLPDVGGGWTPLRAAVGPMEACYEQLFVRHIAAPLRRYDDVPSQAIDLEYDGWFLVLPLLPSRAPPGEVDLFTLLVRRDRKASAPAGQPGARIPDDVFAIFARHSPQKIDCLLEPEGDSDPSYMETTELLRLCRDPTPSQCESALQERPKWATSGESDKAYQAWPAIHTSLVNKDWLSQVHREVAAAGLGEPDAASIEEFYKFRPRQEPDQEGRGLEYALCRREDKCPPPDEAWKPVPLDAFPLEYMRCGVNLYRLAAGKRLLTKEEWPCKGAAAVSHDEDAMKGS